MKEKTKRFFAMLLFIFVSLAVFGQGATTSSMNGRVVDSNEEPLAGATVVAVHVPSGTMYGAAANAEGFYLIQGMRPGGPYKVEASFVGYSKKTYTDITLFLGETFELNPDLQESSTELGEVVIVGAKPSAFNSVKTGASVNISNREITSMPSISRSINDFTRLSPLYGGSNSFAGRDGRYNNIVIDGSNFNNNFGLSSRNMPGGDAEPVSLDAIEEIQVNVAPFDVRQANFTGAGVNAITRKGTNEFSGSVYGYYRDQSFNGTKVADFTLPEATETSTQIIGARVGGPIIKDKLFFFINGEYENSTVPGVEWVAYRPGVNNLGDPNVSRVPADSLTKFSDFLSTKFGYATGPFENYGSFAVKNFKILARIDWNISQKHKFSLRFNTVRSTNNQTVNGSSAPNPRASSNRISSNALSFENSNYGFLNTVHSLSAELNSNLANNISNQLLGTITLIQDTRTSESDVFPFIDIWDGGTPTIDAYMSAGYELFSFNNNVVNNVYTIVDNITYKVGRHNITAGASFEYLYFGNSFMRYGTAYYRFTNLQTFINHVNGVPGAYPRSFALTYSFDPNNTKPVAELGFGQISAYAQDEYNLFDNLKLTYGIRLDMPVYMNELQTNPAVDALVFENNTKLNLGTWPGSKIIPSPRIGFNWDVFGDRSVKVRGGTGIFTGRLPFVWFTNQPTNSGMLQNTVELTSTAQLDSIKFSADPFFNKDVTNWNSTTQTNDPLFPTTAGTRSPSSIAGIDPNFKMPQVWRSSLAADIKLPLDMTLTLEGMFTKDINAIVQRNINLGAPGTTPYNGPDQRPVWLTAGRKINTSISEAMLLTNTDRGYSWTFTAQLSFPIVKNFDGMVAYTAMMAKDISGNPGSQAASAWSGNLSVRGQNDLDMSFSQYLTPHRMVGSLSYRIDYFKHAATTISVYYSGYIDGNFSYRYSGDFNNDGVSSDLIYIPKDQTEITFQTYTSTTGKTYTAEQQASAFWAYVAQDKYLKNHLGEYAERNGAFYPWYNRFDVKILQDFYITVGGKKNTLQLSCDILNAANLLNSDWGIRKRLTVTNGSLLSHSISANNVLHRLVEVGGALPTKTFDNVNTTSSTWGIQLGLRYIFN
jgi:hypothetical protein